MIQSSVQPVPEPIGVSLRLPPDTFLLNPEHRRYIVGRSQLWSMLKVESIGFLLLILLSAFFLLVSLQGGQPLLMASQVQHSGILTQANIIAKREVQRNGPGQVMSYVTYHFTDLSGDMFDVEQGVSAKTFGRFQVGDLVPVKYLPDSPSLAAMTNGAQDDTFAFSSYLVALTGGIGCLITLGSLWFVGMYIWREERFFRQGRLIMGHVMACHGHLETVARSMDVEVQGAEVRGRYMLDLSYSFCAPGGRQIKSAAKRQRNDLRGSHLPSFGQSVAVLYLDDQHFKIL